MCSGTTFLIFIRFFRWILGFWIHIPTTYHLACTTWKKLTLKKTMFQCWSDYTCLQHRIYSSNPCQNNCSIQCTQRKNTTLGPFWRLFLLYVGQTQFWKGPVPSFIIDIHTLLSMYIVVLLWINFCCTSLLSSKIKLTKRVRKSSFVQDKNTQN